MRNKLFLYLLFLPLMGATAFAAQPKTGHDNANDQQLNIQNNPPKKTFEFISKKIKNNNIKQTEDDIIKNINDFQNYLELEGSIFKASESLFQLSSNFQQLLKYRLTKYIGQKNIKIDDFHKPHLKLALKIFKDKEILITLSEYVIGNLESCYLISNTYKDYKHNYTTQLSLISVFKKIHIKNPLKETKSPNDAINEMDKLKTNHWTLQFCITLDYFAQLAKQKRKLHHGITYYHENILMFFDIATSRFEKFKKENIDNKKIKNNKKYKNVIEIFQPQNKAKTHTEFIYNQYKLQNIIATNLNLLTLKVSEIFNQHAIQHKKIFEKNIKIRNSYTYTILNSLDWYTDDTQPEIAPPPLYNINSPEEWQEVWDIAEKIIAAETERFKLLAIGSEIVDRPKDLPNDPADLFHFLNQQTLFQIYGKMSNEVEIFIYICYLRAKLENDFIKNKATIKYKHRRTSTSKINLQNLYKVTDLHKIFIKEIYNTNDHLNGNILQIRQTLSKIYTTSWHMLIPFIFNYFIIHAKLNDRITYLSQHIEWQESAPKKINELQLLGFIKKNTEEITDHLKTIKKEWDNVKKNAISFNKNKLKLTDKVKNKFNQALIGGFASLDTITQLFIKRMILLLEFHNTKNPILLRDTFFFFENKKFVASYFTSTNLKISYGDPVAGLLGLKISLLSISNKKMEQQWFNEIVEILFKKRNILLVPPQKMIHLLKDDKNGFPALTSLNQIYTLFKYFQTRYNLQIFGEYIDKKLAPISYIQNIDLNNIDNTYDNNAPNLNELDNQKKKPNYNHIQQHIIPQKNYTQTQIQTQIQLQLPKPIQKKKNKNKQNDPFQKLNQLKQDIHQQNPNISSQKKKQDPKFVNEIQDAFEYEKNYMEGLDDNTKISTWETFFSTYLAASLGIDGYQMHKSGAGYWAQLIQNPLDNIGNLWGAFRNTVYEKTLGPNIKTSTESNGKLKDIEALRNNIAFSNEIKTKQEFKDAVKEVFKDKNFMNENSVHETTLWKGQKKEYCANFDGNTWGGKSRYYFNKHDVPKTKEGIMGLGIPTTAKDRKGCYIDKNGTYHQGQKYDVLDAHAIQDSIYDYNRTTHIDPTQQEVESEALQRATDKIIQKMKENESDETTETWTEKYFDYKNWTIRDILAAADTAAKAIGAVASTRILYKQIRKAKEKEKLSYLPTSSVGILTALTTGSLGMGALTAIFGYGGCVLGQKSMDVTRAVCAKKLMSVNRPFCEMISHYDIKPILKPSIWKGSTLEKVATNNLKILSQDDTFVKFYNKLKTPLKKKVVNGLKTIVLNKTKKEVYDKMTEKQKKEKGINNAGCIHLILEDVLYENRNECTLADLETSLDENGTPVDPPASKKIWKKTSLILQDLDVPKYLFGLTNLGQIIVWILATIAGFLILNIFYNMYKIKYSQIDLFDFATLVCTLPITIFYWIIDIILETLNLVNVNKDEDQISSDKSIGLFQNTKNSDEESLGETNWIVYSLFFFLLLALVLFLWGFLRSGKTGKKKKKKKKK